jgi:hypothetical protein
MAKILKNNGADRMPIAAVLFLKTIINRLSVPFGYAMPKARLTPTGQRLRATSCSGYCWRSLALDDSAVFTYPPQLIIKKYRQILLNPK